MIMGFRRQFERAHSTKKFGGPAANRNWKVYRKKRDRKNKEAARMRAMQR